MLAYEFGPAADVIIDKHNGFIFRVLPSIISCERQPAKFHLVIRNNIRVLVSKGAQLGILLIRLVDDQNLDGPMLLSEQVPQSVKEIWSAV